MLLYKNMVSDRVADLQRCLKAMGYYQGPEDGRFGPDTEAAVIKLQMDKGLNADGVVGPKTSTFLTMPQDQIQYPVAVPSGYQEIIETFGSPLVSGFAEAYIDFVSTPKELDHIFKYKHPLTGKRGFYCNKHLIITFTNVYQKIAQAGLSDRLQSFDGCFNIRNIRGKEWLSTHSWGISVDHNAKTNPLGAKPVMDAAVVAIFESEGFVWGGNWNRPDGMHFQYAQNY